jgi:hypothetical protein
MKTTKTISLVLTLAMASQLTACTDEEVATALGAVAIVAGAVVIANNTECVDGYRTVCHDYTDYFGYTRTECGEVYDSCVSRVIKRESILTEPTLPTLKEATSKSVATGDSVNEVKWGEAFGIGFQGSARLIGALKSARDEKSLKALTDLGLEKKDIKRIAKGELPTQDGIEALAKSLDQNVQVTRDMISKLVEKAKELKKN